MKTKKLLLPSFSKYIYLNVVPTRNDFYVQKLKLHSVWKEHEYRSADFMKSRFPVFLLQGLLIVVVEFLKCISQHFGHAISIL